MKTVDNCGCCEGISQATPLKVYNRPGLSAIEYRIGKHADFISSLLAKLSDSDLTSLQLLTNRSDNDFSIALLDAFSTVADVLTFYQERIANESYLNTATEQLSIVELARLIGYELNPGVAANTYLSFTLNDTSLQAANETVSGIKTSKNALPLINIKPGTKVQSIPKQDEDVQFFETIEEIRGKAEWNAMELQSSITQATIENATEVYVEGLDNNLKPGDCLFIIEGNKKTNKKIYATEEFKELNITKITFQKNPLILAYLMPIFQLYQPLNLFSQKKEIGIKTIQDLAFGDEGQSSKSVASSHLQSIAKIQNWNIQEMSTIVNSLGALNIPSLPELHVFRKKASLFGYNAPKKLEIEEGVAIILDNLPTVENVNEITLDSEYGEIKGGDDSYVAVQTSSYASAKIYNVSQSDVLPASKYGISGNRLNSH